MKKLFVLLIVIVLTTSGFSQSCLPDGITFHVQADIDSFQVNYPGCTEIEGDVNIGDYGGGGNISDLSGLIVLESIGGNLFIRQNASLTNLRGLENIVTIGGQLGIWSNPLLTSLDGLEGLSYVYSLNISSNAALASLIGIENLESVGYGFYIQNNPALTSLTGLEGLTSVGCGLSIASNNALLSLDGLDNLATTGCGLSVEYNFALVNIDALSNLVYINTGPGTHNLNLKDNISLTSIAGLENIDPESIEDLLIGWNLALTDCDVYSICQYLAAPNGYVAIRYNAPGCNNIGEVEAACGVGVDEPAVSGLRSAVRVYPNPVSDQLKIELSQYPSLKNTIAYIINIDGQLLLRQTLTEPLTEINIRGVSPGVYIIKVVDDGSVVFAKFIKR